MKNGKALGEDGIVMETKKIWGKVLLEKIQNLFHMCLFDSPSEWSNVLWY